MSESLIGPDSKGPSTIGAAGAVDTRFVPYTEVVTALLPTLMSAVSACSQSCR
jgi:hypothetical protein